MTDTISRSGMAATSHPRAVDAALRCLEAGGNAADAAVCAAAVLCVVEPMSTGIGGDAFALVWQHGELTGLNASGRAPASADPDALGAEMPFTGPQSVTVPGAVAGWQALLERHGTWGLDRCLADAIDAAESGFRGDARDRGRLEPHRRRPGGVRRGGARVPAGAGRGHHLAQSRARRHAARHRRRRAGRRSTAAGWRRRSPPRRGWRSPISRRMQTDWVEPLRIVVRRRDRVRAAAERSGRGGAAGDGNRPRLRPRRGSATPTGCTCRPRR